ncbi:MAG: tetratricopeptide repeat protein [Burkholderiales bacterium]
MNHREIANECLARGQLHEAIAHYRRARDEAPRDVRVLIGLGFALAELDESAEATQIIEQALHIDPACADGHYILGQIADRSGRGTDAVRHYEAAVRSDRGAEDAYRGLLRLLVDSDPIRARQFAQMATQSHPEAPEFWFYLGLAQEKTGDDTGALASYRRTCELEPGAHVAHINAGTILMRTGRYRESLPHLLAAARLVPDNQDVHVKIGIVETRLGRPDAAIDSYRRALAIAPHDVVSHILASLTGETPNRAPDAYVAQLFDEYAATFDDHLVGKLKYETPKQIRALLDDRLDSSRRHAVLDLGCGTGLMGVELAQLASRMVGVDLSAKMLEMARAKGLYGRLEQCDLAEMMAGEPAGSYDLIVAADVFVYVGKLDLLYEHAFRLLRPGGLFAFSVEAAPPREGSDTPDDGIGYRLHERQRYVHERSYLERLGRATGFALVDIRAAFCREDGGKPVSAHLALFRRPA